jgi:hypothetical protein
MAVAGLKVAKPQVVRQHFGAKNCRNAQKFAKMRQNVPVSSGP